MDCGGDSGEDNGGLEDFVDLATDITDNSRTIRGNLFIVCFLLYFVYIFSHKYYLCITVKYLCLDNCTIVNNPLKI